jgi:hypothetical protein
MSITSVQPTTFCAAPAGGLPTQSASRAHHATRLLATIIAGAACLALASPPASAAELVTNGDFETGTFDGWTTTQPSLPFARWRVATASGMGFPRPSPPQGTYDAFNGFATNSPGPEHYTLSQTISIPAATTATLTWQDRLVHNYDGQPRLLEVKVLDPANNAVLATSYTYQAQSGMFVDTGWQPHTADLSAFSGQTVKLVFDETIPQAANGIGQAEFDTISVSTPAAEVSDSPAPSGGVARERSLCPAGTSATVTCVRDAEGRLTMIGTGADEVLVGTDGRDRISPMGGKDTVRGNRGDDLISGGPGDDELHGGLGNDRINGNAGNDSLAGNESADSISGGDGNDRLSGQSDPDRLSGGPGHDKISGGDGNDRLRGGDGNDGLSGGAGRDTLSAGAGDDRLRGGSEPDRLSCGRGHNTVHVGANDRVGASCRPG